MHVKQHKYRTALTDRTGRMFRRKIDWVYLNCIRKSCLRRTWLSLRTHARWVSMSQRRRDHLSRSIRRGINLEQGTNSILLLTAVLTELVKWSIQLDIPKNWQAVLGNWLPQGSLPVDPSGRVSRLQNDYRLRQWVFLKWIFTCC